MEKILSFIIPSYNCEQYLERCITSMLCPDVMDALDIIIVNDGSTDSTAQIAERFCSMYPNSVRLINQENKGHGGALNTGCAAALGKYLKVIDADDWVETQNLSPFVKFLADNDYDVVLTHYYTFDISCNEQKSWKTYPEHFGSGYNFDQILSNWNHFSRTLTFHGITYHTAFYRRHGFMLSEHVFYEDHEFATIPCCLAESVAPLDLFIYNYRIGDVSQSVSDTNQLKRIGHIETVLNRLLAEYPLLALASESAGRDYYHRKIQTILLRYAITAMLVSKDRKHGRKQISDMMCKVKDVMPEAYALSIRQIRVFQVLSILRIRKESWDRFMNSPLYLFLRRSKDFR